MHKIDEFKNGYQPFLGHQNGGQAAPLAQWLIDDGLELFRDGFLEETKTAPSGGASGQLVEQAFADGPNDQKRKFQQSAFFAANASIFLSVGRDVSEGIVKASSHDAESLFATRHLGLLRKLVLDAQYLLEEWGAAKLQVPGVFGIGKNPIHCSFQISHAAEQLYFGGSPFFAFADNASESSTALIRIALETRLRFGFGVLGITEKASGAFVPLNMKNLFEALDSHASSITFSVPLAHQRRIYGWSNTYVHTGLRDYIWLPRFAATYLNGILRGGQHDKGQSVHAGIITTKATIEAVQNEVEGKIDLTTHELLKIPAEHCDAVFR